MRRYLPVLTLLAILVLVSGASSKTYNTPTIDGHVQISASDWDADELGVDDPSNDGRYPSDPEVDDLYVTWDADNVYVGIKTVRQPGQYGNGYVVFIDTDGQNGMTGATDFTNSTFYPRHITFSTMGADVVGGAWGSQNSFPTTMEFKHCDDPTHPTDLTGATSAGNPGFLQMEFGIPWNQLYELGDGVVPAGTKMRFIVVVVGGDNSGAYDALPTSSTGIESNPATVWDAYTNLDNYYEVTVDADGDGVPDQGFPSGGSFSGTVTLDDPTDDQTRVTVSAYLNGELQGSDETAAGGGDYTIGRLPDGDYEVVATAHTYLDSTLYAAIENESDVTGLDFTLQRVNGAIEGQVAVTGGPPTDVTITAYDATTGGVAGDGPQTVTGGSGSFRISTVLDGTYRVEATGKGYVEQMARATVADEDTADVGALTLPSVVATKYSFVDLEGSTVLGVGTTVSIPDSSVYYYAEAWVQPRDDDDRVAYWDHAAQDSVHLSATKLDPSYPPSGDIVFAGTDSVAIPGSVITSAMFDDGRAPFLVAGDEIEVLRVLAAGSGLSGLLEVGIAPPAPTKLELTTDADVIDVGTGVARITGQLKDAADNDTRIAGVLVSMLRTGAGGQFRPSTVETDANGRFELEFTGTVAGTTYVSATIDQASPYSAIDIDQITIVLMAGSASSVTLKANPAALRAGESGEIEAAVVDAYGNPVAMSGLSIALTAYPDGLFTSFETPVVTGADGTASSSVTAGSTYGVVEVSGAAGSLAVGTIFVPIDATIVAVDETAPESDPAHNSDAGVDLTIMRATSDAETLQVTLDFVSDWDGVHLMLELESHHDAAGGTSDPFGFPVNYGQPLLPDYVFTYKYAAGDYADLRRFNAGQWEHYNFVTKTWQIGYTPEVNAVAYGYIVRDQEKVIFRTPFSALETAFGDTVRLEAYVTQETEGQKRTALDSVPQDNTLDMDPATGEWWENATNPVTLVNWAVHEILVPGEPPELTGGTADPSTAQPGDLVTYSVDVADAGAGIGDVFINLSSIGGPSFLRMMDDGRAPDGRAADGVYSAADTLRAGAANGDHTVTVTARDASNVSESTLDITVNVDNPPVPLRQFDDPVGDDHGPDQTSGDGTPVAGLYYFYPTNYVFLPGSFDLTKVELFADGDQIVFRVSIDDLANADDPGSADWGAPQPSEQTCDNPYRTDLNLQKIDIYIDAKEGEGATSGFPNRYMDIATVDAWDYGIAVEGWGKWFVKSNGENSIASWTLYKNDSEISMCDDYEVNYVDIRVDRALFGDDLDDQNENLAYWDIIVAMSSHDGDSNDDNLGSIRWVNANTSEWQIGGGLDSQGGRDRDANIMDLAMSPGEGHEPGRTQQEMLDYTTEEARLRFDENKVACVVEASFAVDTSPPVIRALKSDPDVEHIPWVALDGAPAVFWTTITDVNNVDEAMFYWYPVGLPASLDSVRMVNLTGDIWGGDVSREDIVAHTNVVDQVKTGPSRVILGAMRAVDGSPNHNAIKTVFKEIALPEPWAAEQRIARIDTMFVAGQDYTGVFQDGTVLVLEPGQSVPEDGLDALLIPVAESLVDLSNIRSDMSFVGVARDITLQSSDRSDVALTVPAWLVMHYPQYDVGGLNENAFGIFEWNDSTERWIARGGGQSRRNNTVTCVGLERLGFFGLFEWDALDAGGSSGLTGVLAEPNPFSPNGDGLYDDMVVTFYLGRDADYVNIEFYDLAGVLARRLVFQDPTNYTGRTPAQVVWDGTDMNGNVVPYGIYVMRVEARFKTEPLFERVNRPVAIIK